MTVAPIDSLRLHPAAEKVPLASGEDLAALDASLRENGQQDPIDVTSEGVILDGRTRWTLLRKQGATTVHVRVLDYPEAQQTAYIIDRALSRRHLTMTQKQALNALMATHVIEEREHPKTGETMRIGYGQQQRAEKLGVARQTVQNWDAEVSDQSWSDQPAPTHFVRGGGNPTPYPIHPTPRDTAKTPRGVHSNTHLRSPASATPQWMAAFTRWAHKALPEQRKHLLRIKEEVERALALIDGTEEKEASDD